MRLGTGRHYQRAVYSASPAAVIDRARECRTLGIELAVEEVLPVVVALALAGERARFVGRDGLGASDAAAGPRGVANRALA